MKIDLKAAAEGARGRLTRQEAAQYLGLAVSRSVNVGGIFPRSGEVIFPTFAVRQVL